MEGSSLLQARQLLGKGAAEDTTAAEERLASMLARGPPPPSALQDTAASRSSAVYSCPSSCQWCEGSGKMSDVVVRSDVKYGQAPNLMTGQTQDLLMDVYQVPSSAARPVLVVIHGGSFKSTSTKDGAWAPWVSKLVALRGARLPRRERRVPALRGLRLEVRLGHAAEAQEGAPGPRHQGSRALHQEECGYAEGGP